MSNKWGVYSTWNASRSNWNTPSSDESGNEAFSPLSISNLIHWFDADQLSGYSDDDNVTDMVDYSGNSNDLSQGTAANQAKYKINIAGDLPALSFDSGDYYNITPLNIAQPFTVFMIIQPSSQQSCYLLCNYADDASSIRLNSFNFRMNINLGTNSETPDNYYAADNLMMVDAIGNSTSSTIYSSYPDDTDVGDGGTNQFTGLTFGSRGGFLFNAFHGYLMELAIYSRDIDASDRTDMRAYLVDKWGV